MLLYTNLLFLIKSYSFKLHYQFNDILYNEQLCVLFYLILYSTLKFTYLENIT